jgi:hypothetical protein
MVHFITENWLKTYMPIADNVDMTSVTPWIKTSSELWIQPILGTYFYQSLLVKYNNQTLTSDEQNLVSLIQPAIGWRASSDAMYSLSRLTTNKGVQTQSGENSEAVDLNELQFAMSMYTSKAAFYENRIIIFLKENKDLFPDFISDNNQTDIKPQKNNNYGRNFLII